MRLIDGDVLWEKLDDEPWYDNADRDEIALPIVAAAPTVDAVVVTRCKDCAHSTLPSELTQRYGKPGTLTCHNSARHVIDAMWAAPILQLRRAEGGVTNGIFC